jgi:hypothetical protein
MATPGIQQSVECNSFLKLHSDRGPQAQGSMGSVFIQSDDSLPAADELPWAISGFCYQSPHPKGATRKWNSCSSCWTEQDTGNGTTRDPITTWEMVTDADLRVAATKGNVNWLTSEHWLVDDPRRCTRTIRTDRPSGNIMGHFGSIYGVCIFMFKKISLLGSISQGRTVNSRPRLTIFLQ